MRILFIKVSKKSNWVLNKIQDNETSIGKKKKKKIQCSFFKKKKICDDEYDYDYFEINNKMI